MIRMFKGYEFIVCTESDESVPASYLTAILHGASPHVVFDDETHVHHKNHIRWDNRIENLEVKDRDEHLREHFEENSLTPGSERSDWWDKDSLHDMYWNQGMTQQEIADEVGATQKSVSQAFEKLGIETRSPGRNTNEPWHDKEVLEKLYIEKEMTQKEVANRLGCSEPTVRKWLDKTGAWPPD